MIQLLGYIITLATIAGLAVILEGATGTVRWLSAWVHTRPRPPAPPHASSEPTENSNHEEG